MSKVLISVAIAAAFSATMFTGQASAKSNVAILHAFCTKVDCTDGDQPVGGLVADPQGNYYGTTVIGGDGGVGSIYRASKNGGKWSVYRIYSFCHSEACPDGASPQGSLIIDTAGNLYGIASDGGNSSGNNGAGLVYELSPNGKKWKYKVIYKFCSAEVCLDGRDPYQSGLSYQGAASGAPYDGASPLYGTTQYGGANDTGTIFQLTPKGKRWSEKVIYNFCSQTNCIDGGTPFAGVSVDATGNIFGGATLGGVDTSENCCGVVYELKKRGSGWDYTSLHMFCSTVVNDVCLDGRFIMAPPVIDAAGNLYGTTTFGGANDNGTVFKLEPHGSGFDFSTPYSFCQAACKDGSNPWAGALALGADGTLYGTTVQGGAGGGGTVFSMSSSKPNKLTTLASFSEKTGGEAFGGVVLDQSGALFGTLAFGGKHSGGTLFQVIP